MWLFLAKLNSLLGQNNLATTGLTTFYVFLLYHNFSKAAHSSLSSPQSPACGLTRCAVPKAWQGLAICVCGSWDELQYKYCNLEVQETLLNAVVLCSQALYFLKWMLFCEWCCWPWLPDLIAWFPGSRVLFEKDLFYAKCTKTPLHSAKAPWMKP